VASGQIRARAQIAAATVFRLTFVDIRAAGVTAAGVAGGASAAFHAARDVDAFGGRVWQQRYHTHALRTPREVRAALVYVLLNLRKHLRAAPGIDPCSSGPWFDGWAHQPTLAPLPAPVCQPRTWLAAIGWRRVSGALDGREMPAVVGAVWRQAA
jgi:hypothetical protein